MLLKATSTQRETESKGEKLSTLMEKKLRLPLRPGVVVQVPSVPHARQLQEWQHALVGKFIDELPPSPAATEAAATRLWHPSGGMQVIPYPRGFVFKLEKQEDRSRIMDGGPYSVDGKLLALQPLPPCTSPDVLQFNRVPVWVTLAGLPFDLHCPEVALAAAQPAGNPIEADVVLASAAEGAGRVRVRVEIEAEEPLLQGTYLDAGDGYLIWVGFEYEGIPRICRNCMCIGHADSSCKKTPIQARLIFTKRLQGIGKRINAAIVNDQSAESVLGSPVTMPRKRGKSSGSARPLVCADQAAAFDGRAAGKEKAEEVEDDLLIMMPLSGPADDLNGPYSAGPSPYPGLDSVVEMPPDQAQRGGSGKRKHKAEKVK